MKKKVMSTILMLAMMATMLAACGSKEAQTSEEEKKVIKIGVRADGIDQLNVVREKIEELGYIVEESIFDDSIQPNVALAEGSIDVNWYQHIPYLESYNAENGTELVMIEPTTAYPLFAMFSEKYESIDELPEGATIGLCNDATNQARGLRLLESAGLITLDETVEVPTMYDVIENPHNLQFMEAEMSILPQSISDVDAICLAALHMVNAGLSAETYLYESPDAKDYAVGFVVRKEDQDAQWVKEIAAAVQCEELAEFFVTEKQGAMIPTWN